VCLSRKTTQLQLVSFNLRKYHADVLADWKVVNAIAAPDYDDIHKLYEEIGKADFRPCASCLSFFISKTTDLGSLMKFSTVFTNPLIPIQSI
jgi:hypothetical protein